MVQTTYNRTTGFVPAIYDKDTHYVTNLRLTLDILKRLDDFGFVEEVSGDYTGTLTGLGTSHEGDIETNNSLQCLDSI
jgi:hypothetical protein